MTHLSDDNLFARELPLQWQPVLELVRELDLMISDQQQPTMDKRREQATIWRQKVLQHAGRLSEETPESLQSSSPEFQRWFTEATLLWPFFARAGGEVLVNTIGTRALGDYPVDLPTDDTAMAVLRRALVRTFEWSHEDLDQIEKKLHRLTWSLSVKSAISRRLARSLQADAPGEARRKAADLICRVYGQQPWQANDVDLVITTTAVFFCLPFEGLRLTSADFNKRPSVERERISQFLERVRAGQQSLKGIRFPAFGAFDAALVDANLIAELTEEVRTATAALGLSDFDEEKVAATFSTMVTILPTQDVEKYIVHDVWGHGWQESLCEFESVYRDMGTLADSSVVPVQAFEAKNGRTHLRPEILLQVVETDLRHRISVGINLVVSEFLADLIEYKFLQQVRKLPSSSLFVDSPLCLDLTLEDTRRMIDAWRRPYHSLSLDIGERERFRAHLAAAGFPEPGLSEAIEQAASLIDNRFGAAFMDGTEVRAGTGGVQANLLQRIMLSVIAIDTALDRFLAEGADRYWATSTTTARPRWQCPSACTDLLVLLLGWLYEQHRAVNVWGLDELITRELRPVLLRLEEAIAVELGRS